MKRLTIGIAATLAGLSACDEANVREGSTQFTTYEQAAVRLLVTPDGIATLYDVSNPDGLALDATAVPVVSDGDLSVEIGPLAQTLPVRSRMTQASEDALEVTTTFRNAQVFVPVRIRDGFEVRICRYRVAVGTVSATGTVGLVDTEEGRQFDVLAPPDVTLETVQVAAVDGCPLPTKLLTPEDLGTTLVSYVEDAVAQAAAAALRTSPLEIVGFIEGNLQATRLSVFENRRGTLTVEGRTGSVELTGEGLNASLDATADAQRARCAPPVSLDGVGGAGAMALDPAVVRRFDGDFAVAVSTAWIGRAAQAAARAGFACRGLEDLRPIEQNDRLLPVDDVLIEELGLGAVPVGDAMTLALRPGALPRVSSDAGNGTIRVDWPDLQIEVYGQVFGAWTRIASVVSDVALSLRPRSPSLDTASFDIEAIEVREPELDTELARTLPPEDDVARWTRRALLLLLDEELDLPLPLLPAAPLRVVNTQVRTQDIVYYVRFEEQ